MAAGLSLAAGTAFAQQTERDDRRIDRMERTLREMERIVRQGAGTGRPVVVAPETLPAELDALRTRLDDLEATVRSQNGTVEALTNELNQARRQAATAGTQVGELTERLRALEARPVVEPEPGPEEAAAIDPAGAAAAQAAAAQRTADEGSLGSTPGAAGDPATTFQRARTQLLEGDYASASAGFAAFVERYPDDGRAGEASYWLGETLYIREDYAGAAQAYIAALRGWPQVGWAPDALVKLSGALIEINQAERACQTLGEFTRRYAGAGASVKARANAVRTRARCA